MVELETIKYLLQPPYVLLVCRHAGFATTRLSHYLVDDKLRVSVDVKPWNPKFGGYA
jgi:hypothetical protein